MTELHQYQVYCIEEDAHRYVWDTVAPSQCPEPVNHTSRDIDTNRTVIVATIGENYVTAQDRSVGAMQVTSFTTDVPAGTVGDIHTQDYSWETDIVIWEVTIHSHYAVEDDVINIVAAPNTPVGITTANIASGTSIFPVSATATEYLFNGYNVSISDGVNTDNIGIVKQVNLVDNTITTSVPTTNSFNAGSLIIMNRYLMKDYVLPSIITCNNIELMNKGLKGLSVPSGTILRVFYTNNSVAAKKIYWHLEYFMA